MIFQDQVWINWKINIICYMPSMYLVWIRNQMQFVFRDLETLQCVCLPFTFCLSSGITACVHVNNIKQLKVSSSAFKRRFLVVHLKEAVHKDFCQFLDSLCLSDLFGCVASFSLSNRSSGELSPITHFRSWLMSLVADCFMHSAV